jgi:hypothetical protein
MKDILRKPHPDDRLGLTPIISDLNVRSMGDKSPKATSKHVAQKHAKAAAASQKKKDAASAKQAPKTNK